MKRSYTSTSTNTSTPSLGEPKKIVLLGDGYIGKSTLFDKLNKLSDDNYKFPKKYKATDNLNFIYLFTFHQDVNSLLYGFQILNP